MNDQTWAMVLFVLLIGVCALIATYGMSRNKQAWVVVALLVGAAGAVELALLTPISMQSAGMVFAVIFAVLGLLITAEGAAKRDRELWLQGLVQLFISAALLTYAQAPSFVRGIREGRPIVVLIAVNLPWLILGVLLVVFVIRKSRR